MFQVAMFQIALMVRTGDTMVRIGETRPKGIDLRKGVSEEGRNPAKSAVEIARLRKKGEWGDLTPEARSVVHPCAFTRSVITREVNTSVGPRID